MATFDSGRQRYSMNFYASHQRRSYTGRPSRPAEGQLRVCAVTRRRFSSGCKSHPANAPAGSNRSSHGGNEVAEALD